MVVKEINQVSEEEKYSSRAKTQNKVFKSGYREKSAVFEEGIQLNYVEGPNNGQALLLIHDNSSSWQDYKEALCLLAKEYHVWAIDMPGHGKSSKDEALYQVTVIGQIIESFIRNVIRTPVIISGHSVGGLVAVWLATNVKDKVKGVLLEDPQLFSGEPGRIEHTNVYLDSFKTCHDFLNQQDITTYDLYYLENCTWIPYFGMLGGKVIEHARKIKRKDENAPIEMGMIPDNLMHIFLYLQDYDPLFGESIYKLKWMEGFDHAEMLSQIDCRCYIVQTNWSIKGDILMSSMSGEDAFRAESIVKDCKLIEVESGHDFHYEKASEFVKLLKKLCGEVS